MSDWIFWIAYAAGFLFTYRRMYIAFSHPEAMGAGDAFERVASAAMSMCVSTMWPVVLVGYGIWRFATPVTPAERQAELDTREREIERMERALGINKDDRWKWRP